MVFFVCWFESPELWNRTVNLRPLRWYRKPKDVQGYKLVLVLIMHSARMYALTHGVIRVCLLCGVGIRCACSCHMQRSCNATGARIYTAARCHVHTVMSDTSMSTRSCQTRVCPHDHVNMTVSDTSHVQMLNMDMSDMARHPV